ncbi:AraC family transcriptional regulator [Vibrio sp. LaRot3]|uniref:AraC family transcriptional regulator n=1 Tax=Vibrio sp. LaRot3 TaxID=2998829 RepID=UPI0022CE276F|nr:AraC family transcriptional regulator [Vibrio sp. LaRot3]MDA0150120.1 AraC family transcriptional regulator [Vibrio sp. LaRot3]
MHYSISHQTTEHHFLSITSRKKLLKHTLLRVEQGIVLARLGKQEYAIEAGQSLWLPFDSLTALTFFPQTKTSTVEVSCRVTKPLPANGGYVGLNELTTALMNRLTILDEHQHKQALLTVMLDELAQLKPKLENSALTQQINAWSVNQPSNLAKDCQLVLQLREARKWLLSGKKEDQVIEQLFAGDKAAYQSLKSAILG